MEWVRADISDAQLNWDVLVDGVDAIFHLAWSTVPFSADQDPALNVVQNVPPGVRLAAAAAKQGTSRLVFISSGGTVYGAPQWVPIDEQHPTLPTSFYGEGKMTMERHLDLFRALRNLDTTVLRVSNPYGPGQRQGRNFGAITTFALRALMNEEIVIWGDGSSTRDYLYIDDVIDAAILAASSATPTSTYNIGSGEGRSLTQIVYQLQSLIGHPIRVRYEPARPYDVPTNVLNIKHAARNLGWAPNTSFKDGLKRTVLALQTDLEAWEDLPGPQGVISR